jgi:hypothetical protein
LKEAAYIALYSMPNPQNPNKPKLSLDPPGIIHVIVNEELHRFPVDIAEGTRVGEPAANVQMQWTPVPEDFKPVPDVQPPPTAIDPGRSQRFVTLNGAMTYHDSAQSHIRAFGHGRTFPMVAGVTPQLHLGAVVNVREGFGSFEGLQGTVLVNGHIKPPTDLSLCIVARFMDPEARLKAEKLGPITLSPNPDPDYATLLLVADVDPSAPAEVHYGPDGAPAGWQIHERLRLMNVDFDVASGVRSKTEAGVPVGIHTAAFRFDSAAEGPALPVSSTDGVMTFTGRDGKPIGTLRINMYEGDAFTASLPGTQAQLYRFGAFGPILGATGAFEGAIGMMTVNGTFCAKPRAASTLYIIRMYDPQGAIRTSMKEAWGLQKRVWAAASLDKAEEQLLRNVELHLSQGIEIRDWWERKDRENTFADRFEIARTFNPAETAYGFCDETKLRERNVRLMGLAQQMVFDRPKTPQGSANRPQLREYAMRYFLRSSDFREPVAFDRTSFGEVPAALRGALWKRPASDESLRGFGFSQLYYKLVKGEIGRFEGADASAIVDLRELGERFQWILLKVRMFNTKATFAPLGDDGPQMVIPLRSESYVIISRELVTDRPGEYGIGYAIMPGPETGGDAAYGPGHFDTGFQTIRFTLGKDGVARARTALAVNRAEKFMNLPFDPLQLGFKAADTLTLGIASQFVQPFAGAFPPFLSAHGLDPLQAYIALANAATGGAAGESFGVSKISLEHSILTQLFQANYKLISGAVLTYRSVPDWTAGSALPDWIRTGVHRAG